MKAYPPVAGKKGEGEPRGRIFGARPRDKLLQQDQAEEDQEIQGPDAQNAAHIEGLELDGAGFVALPEEQFRDEECAEQEEDGDAQVAEKADVVEPIMLRRIDRNKVHPMDDKHDHEGNEAEYIQFRAIVAFDCHVGARRPFLRIGCNGLTKVWEVLIPGIPHFVASSAAGVGALDSLICLSLGPRWAVGADFQIDQEAG